jgi:hypothetical protein
VDLIGENEDTPLETAIIWLTPQPGAGEPSEHTLQAAVNGAGLVAQLLVRSSGLAFEKAAKTMERISDSPRPHNKGVGATDDGWKLTYITYASHDEGADPPPMLCLVLQRLSAGEDEALAAMNRTMYEALQAGRDIKTVLREVENAAPSIGAEDVPRCACRFLRWNKSFFPCVLLCELVYPLGLLRLQSGTRKT